MTNTIKAIGAVLLLAGFLLLLVGPSPLARDLLFTPAAVASLSVWREGIEYLAYLTEVLLILFFGGFIFVEALAKRIATTLGSVADGNIDALNRAIAEATDNGGRMTAYLTKFTSHGRLSSKEWRDCLSTMFKLQKSAANPLAPGARHLVDPGAHAGPSLRRAGPDAGPPQDIVRDGADPDRRLRAGRGVRPSAARRKTRY